MRVIPVGHCEYFPAFTDAECKGYKTIKITRYKVKGRFYGISEYRDGQTVRYGFFGQAEKATARLQAVVQSFLVLHMPQGNVDYDIQTRHDNGLMKQTITLGKELQKKAMLWVELEKKITPLGKQLQE